jgi:hypothetical protein
LDIKGEKTCFSSFNAVFIGFLQVFLDWNLVNWGTVGLLFDRLEEIFLWKWVEISLMWALRCLYG